MSIANISFVVFYLGRATSYFLFCEKVHFPSCEKKTREKLTSPNFLKWLFIVGNCFLIWSFNNKKCFCLFMSFLANLFPFFLRSAAEQTALILDTQESKWMLKGSYVEGKKESTYYELFLQAIDFSFFLWLQYPNVVSFASFCSLSLRGRFFTFIFRPFHVSPSHSRCLIIPWREERSKIVVKGITYWIGITVFMQRRYQS